VWNEIKLDIESQAAGEMKLRSIDAWSSDEEQGIEAEQIVGKS